MADRGWMYTGWKRGRPSREWVDKTQEFLDRAFSISELVESDSIKCPCSVCRNYIKHKRPRIELHLCQNGFKENYQTWTAHGERRHENQNHFTSLEDRNEGYGETDRMEDMLVDLAGEHPPLVDETPTGFAQTFYRMVDSADQRVHENTLHSTLSAVARILAIKSQYNLSVACHDDFVDLLHELLPPNSRFPKNFYQSKKLLEGLGMPYHKIDVCSNNCMLYYKDHSGKDKCDICGTSRYKDGSNKVPHKVLRYLPITPRLQRLYAHEGTAKLMHAHKEPPLSSSSKMLHPCHGEAWKQFDADFPDFAEDARNVRLGFATDGFTPYSVTAASYSCWPVFWVPYNLPPSVCMRPEYIFLAMVIPGPEHPGKNLSILMQPMVDELLELWEGVETWDALGKRNFKMRASYLWSIHDFPAYGMFSGWSTHGILACPQCMSDSNAYRLKKGGKPTWFDCHRRFLPRGHTFRNQANAFRKNKVVLEDPPRRLTGEDVKAHMYRMVGDSETYGKEHNWTHISCLWQLPYFSKLLLRHNIDVMHNEKNMAEATWNTCFDISDKTKDNVKARQDLELLCSRPFLHLYLKNGKWQKPRAPYCIDKNDKTTILNWFQELKFPDSYAANLRRGVNVLQKKIFGLKSHDYHIFIERILPVAFRGFMPEDIWTCLAELSYFYRQLCAKQISKESVLALQGNIAVLICKLEKIFPPGFFNPMQHLVIHLADEALLGGPVQYRWMYPFERYIQRIRKKVRNKARVEGSIAEAYLVEEAANFLSLYFRTQVHSIRNPTHRYDDGGSSSVSGCGIKLFEHAGRCFHSLGFRDLTAPQYKAAALYILTNIPEMDDFFNEFDNEQWKGRSHPSEKEISNLRLNGWKGTRGSSNGPSFFDWFKNICKIRSSVHNVLRQISYGFRKRVSSYGCCDVNGYRFRSEKYERNKALATTNSGVCVSCTDGDGNVLEYFGVIEDILKISWEGREQLDLILFYCRWFDPTSRGVRRTENLGLVEVKHITRLRNFEPFVLASQVTQVYYLSYACADKPDLRDWSVVYHVAPRDRLPPIDINNDTDQPEGPTDDMLFFQEDGLEGTFVIDLSCDLEIIASPTSDEITDPKELEELQRENMSQQQEETLESDEGEGDDAESYGEDCYEEEDL